MWKTLLLIGRETGESEHVCTRGSQQVCLLSDSKRLRVYGMGPNTEIDLKFKRGTKGANIAAKDLIS
jgi:hypothetical protein